MKKNVGFRIVGFFQKKKIFFEHIYIYIYSYLRDMLYIVIQEVNTYSFRLICIFPDCLLVPIIVTSLSCLRNLATCYRPTALNTQLSGLDFPPDRIIIAHQFRASSLRCDLIVCPRVHNSLQPHRYRGCRSRCHVDKRCTCS